MHGGGGGGRARGRERGCDEDEDEDEVEVDEEAKEETTDYEELTRILVTTARSTAAAGFGPKPKFL